MGAPSKRARRVRTAPEFNIPALVARLEALRVTSGAYSWSLTEIQRARDAQMAGQFERPARLAESFRTDDAMYVAHRNRLAPQRALPVRIVPAKDTAAAKAIAGEAEALFGAGGCGILPETMVELNSQLANHGVAFGINTWTPREDGSRTDVEVHAWPIEFVRWNAAYREPLEDGTFAPPRGSFTTRVEPGSVPLALGTTKPLWPAGEVPITHGDGRWVVFQAREIEPFKDCCLLPGALTWARHAFGFRDWGKGSAAHGNAKVVGTMAEGIGTEGDDGAAFLELMRLIASGDVPYGIMPAGYKVDYITNNSAAWQIFQELVKTSEISASRIYIGQDGSLGTNNSGPGIDLRALFGVTDDIVEGDLHALERGVKTGVIDPWCARNFTDSSLAPQRLYDIPDADQDERRKAIGEANTAYLAAIDGYRKSGFVVDQDFATRLAEQYGVAAPLLKPPAVPVAPDAPPAAA